jgi:hypothetical protein
VASGLNESLPEKAPASALTLSTVACNLLTALKTRPGGACAATTAGSKKIGSTISAEFRRLGAAITKKKKGRPIADQIQQLVALG